MSPTEEEINYLLASKLEFSGYVFVPHSWISTDFAEKQFQVVGGKDRYCLPESIPNFFADLNLVSLLEDKLDTASLHKYKNKLGDLCLESGSKKAKARAAICAKAPSRAMALYEVFTENGDFDNCTR